MVDSCLALIHEKTRDYIKELAEWEREEKQLCPSPTRIPPGPFVPSLLDPLHCCDKVTSSDWGVPMGTY